MPISMFVPVRVSGRSFRQLEHSRCYVCQAIDWQLLLKAVSTFAKHKSEVTDIVVVVQ